MHPLAQNNGGYMKKLYYDEGPLIMTCGIAGQFKIGVPREVSDDLAKILLRKGRLKEVKQETSATPAPDAPAAPAKHHRKKEE
jgi:hypothetical protein